MNDQKISRRSFLDWLIRGGLLTTLAGMVVPALAYLWPVTRRGPIGGLVEVGKEEEVPVWDAKKVIVGGSALLLVRTPNAFKAFSAVCTHLGCLVQWENSRKEIACPCHAGFFDLEGKVIAGPPPQPLKTYPVSVIDGKIMVQI